MAPKQSVKRGFTLVELMIVVAIVGVLAALAIFGVRKYVAAAKTSEARNGLGQIAKDASAAFDREGMSGDVLPPGGHAGASRRLCPSAAAVPIDVGLIRGRKYQSGPLEWTTNEGWICLRFSMRDPQYYQYDYVANGFGNPGDGFVTTAHGDLNGDGKLSTFSLAGGVLSGGSNSMELVIAPNITEVDGDE